MPTTTTLVPIAAIRNTDGDVSHGADAKVYRGKKQKTADLKHQPFWVFELRN
jgi:hypothetical protein